ncbi:MAG: ankyrin repeat domain-containing protein [Candidatus Riflebacteria bacterium]|nr:ankyrin repeat domain-containing protein [Candidatus Riflebacteria bacterium]
MKVQEHKAFRQILVNNEDQRRAACERILKDHGIECPLSEIRRVFQNILDRPKGTPKKELMAIWQKAQQELTRYIESYGEEPFYLTMSVPELSECLLDACYTSVNHTLFARIGELIRHGADVKARDDFGNLAFRYLAVRFDSSQNDEQGNTVFTLAPVVTEDLLKAFLEAGLNINETCSYHGKSSTFWICLAGVASRNMLRIMLEHGARINERDSNGRTALMECRDGRADAECIKFLLENGADPSITDTPYDSGLHHAVTTRGRGEDIVEMIEGGADVNLHNQEGNTPLHIYAKASIDNAILNILFEHGSDVNARNKDGDTPLHIAAGRCGSYDTVKALIAQGADVNAVNSVGNTPLHTTSLRWDYDTSCNAECLLENGANPNQRNLAGMTPLLLAAGFDRQLVVRALVEHGADVDLTTAAGQTAYDIAIANGFVETASAINPSARADYEKTPAGMKKQQEKTAIIAKIKAGYMCEKGDREGFWELSWDPSHNPPSYRFYENDLGGMRTSWFESESSAIALIGDISLDSHHLKKDPNRDLAKEALKKAQEGPLVDPATLSSRLGKYLDLCSFALSFIRSEEDLNCITSALDTMHAHNFGYSDRHIAMKAMIPQILEIARRHVHSLDDLLLLCSKTPDIIENLPEDSEDSPVGRLYSYDLAAVKARGLVALNMSEFVGAEPITIGGKEIEL